MGFKLMDKIPFSPISVNIMSDRSNPDPFVIQKSRTMNKRVKLNVGGIRHEIIIIITTIIIIKFIIFLSGMRLCGRCWSVSPTPGWGC